MEKAPNIFRSFQIRVPTPDGVMWVHVVEDENGEPFQIFTNAGKCGTSFNAWAAAFANLLTLFINNVPRDKFSLPHIIAELSLFTTDRLRMASDGALIKSGPEGICYALRQYLKDRDEQNNARNPRQTKKERLVYYPR